MWSEVGFFLLSFYAYSRITKGKSDMQKFRELYIQEQNHLSSSISL